MKIVLKSVDGKLIPVDSHGQEVLAKIGNCEVLVDIKKNRSVGNHRRFFAFVNETFNWQDKFDSVELWRKYLEMCAGHFDTAMSPKTGEPMYFVKSIAWDELDELEFQSLFNEIVQAYLNRFGDTLSQYQLDKVVRF